VCLWPVWSPLEIRNLLCAGGSCVYQMTEPTQPSFSGSVMICCPVLAPTRLLPCLYRRHLICFSERCGDCEQHPVVSIALLLYATALRCKGGLTILLTDGTTASFLVSLFCYSSRSFFSFPQTIADFPMRTLTSFSQLLLYEICEDSKSF